MKRDEAGLAAVGLAVAATIGGAAVEWASWWSNSRYSNGPSNFLSLVAAPSMVAAIAVAAWTRWHSRCATRFCVRRGEHEVAGTLRKVCHDHHTLEHHELVHASGAGAHRRSGRLGWGESHRRHEPEGDIG